MAGESYVDGRLTLVKFGPLGFASNNCYVLSDNESRDAIVIDAPEGCEAIQPALEGLNLRALVVTHRHRDHWAGIDSMLSFLDAPVITGVADREGYEQYVSKTLTDGDLIEVGALQVKALHTPGHTVGHMCLLTGDHLLSGDTLFPGGPGRTRSNADLMTETGTPKTVR